MEPIFPTPVHVAQVKVLSQQTIKLWEEAVWTVKEAQEKFIKAYRATLAEVAGKDWAQTWRTNPHFAHLLNEVEEGIKEICRKHGMTLKTFNRYRNAARKTVLLGVPFDLSKKLSLEQLAVVQTASKELKGEEKERTIKKVVEQFNKQKQINSAAAVVSKVTTVLPLPDAGEHADDYLEGLSTKLQAHLAVVKERFGEDAVLDICNKLVQNVTG